MSSELSRDRPHFSTNMINIMWKHVSLQGTCSKRSTLIERTSWYNYFTNNFGYYVYREISLGIKELQTLHYLRGEKFSVKYDFIFVFEVV
jgi:hypothetical protein